MLSPYLFPSQKSSLKLLFSVPLAGKIIFTFLGSKIINSLLIKSSRPHRVPYLYQRLKKILSQPQMLSAAVTEKQAIDVKILQEIAVRHIPLVAIWGDKDETIAEKKQIYPLRKWIPDLKEVRLKQAGHAIPFTSPHILADIIKSFIMEK